MMKWSVITNPQGIQHVVEADFVQTRRNGSIEFRKAGNWIDAGIHSGDLVAIYARGDWKAVRRVEDPPAVLEDGNPLRKGE